MALPQQTVLIVEDEIFIRMMALDIILDAGFSVIEASDADEAISLLESRSDIDIVFSDIKMPGSLDGLELAGAIRQRWPHIATLLTSGHTSVADLPPDTQFLAKPYRAAWLADRLNGMIAS